MIADNTHPNDRRQHTPPRITVEDLVGSNIVTADGKRVGRIVEIRVSSGPDYRVVELEFGRYGWLDRLNMLRLIHGKYRPIVESERISWDAVASFERFTVTLKPGYDRKARPA
ncbi:MAG: PRC-barrel domain-containing protein [Ktedonobacterales bacterium]